MVSHILISVKFHIASFSNRGVMVWNTFPACWSGIRTTQVVGLCSSRYHWELANDDCIGLKPICGSCSKVASLGDCEYGEVGRTYADRLQEQITVLETRLEELEHPDRTSNLLTLHNPYATRNSGLTRPTSRASGPGTSIASIIFSRLRLTVYSVSNQRMRLPDARAQVGELDFYASKIYQSVLLWSCRKKCCVYHPTHSMIWTNIYAIVWMHSYHTPFN